MFERRIHRGDIATVINAGQAIEVYDEDEPFPSMLLLGLVKGRPLHVVVARDPETGICVVVTAYEPDASQWTPDWRSRRMR